MKKVLALILALVMVFAMGTVAFADELTEENNNQDVTINVTANEEKSYSVDITWQDLTFTYTYGDWDESTHAYEGSWDKTSATITVINHSDDAIVVTADYNTDEKDTVGTVSASLDTAEIELPSAVDKQTNDESLKGVFTLSITGAPTANEEAEVVIATITVTFEPGDAQPAG